MVFHPTRVRVVSELLYKNSSNVRLFGINFAFSTNQSTHVSELYYKNRQNVRLFEINHALSTNQSARCI